MAFFLSLKVFFTFLEKSFSYLFYFHLTTLRSSGCQTTATEMKWRKNKKPRLIHHNKSKPVTTI